MQESIGGAQIRSP